jgi:hypothetical protein
MRRKSKMKGKVLVGILLGLMLLGVSNMAFSEEQPKPQAKERFVLKDIQPVGDESNGRVPLTRAAPLTEEEIVWALISTDSRSDMEGFTTKGSWRYIAFQPVQSFKRVGFGTVEWDSTYQKWVFGGIIVFWDDEKSRLYTLKGKTFGIHSEHDRMLCVSAAGSGYRWETIYHTIEFYGDLLPLWLGHGVEHVIQGKLTLLGHTFESDQAYPLTFKLVKERGYVYLCGRGGIPNHLSYSDYLQAISGSYLGNTKRLRCFSIPAKA